MFDPMTSTVPRRMFDELMPSPADQPSKSAAALRDEGMIRVHGTISIELNEKIKMTARRQGKHADQLIGELISRSAAEVDKMEAQMEAARLRARFGDDWLNVLQGGAGH
jgi:hypothetical protein